MTPEGSGQMSFVDTLESPSSRLMWLNESLLPFASLRMQVKAAAMVQNIFLIRM